MTKLVVDASAYFPIAVTGEIPRQLRDFELVGPPLLWSETASALREAAWREILDEALASAAVARLHDLGVTQVRDDELTVAAYDVARQLGWAKTYDAEYVALARILQAPLLTRDLRLRRGAQRLVTFYDIG